MIPTTMTNLSAPTANKDTKSTETQVHIISSDEDVERPAREFQSFLFFIFSVSIFGASAFAVVASEMADPETLTGGSSPFSLRTVRSLLGTAWLCFILALAVAGYSSSAVTIFLQHQHAGTSHNKRWAWRWELGGILISALLHLLLVGAFLALSLAMVAYTGFVGWIAVGFCTVAGVLVLCLITYQLMRGL